jgi:hypothetical protein
LGRKQHRSNTNATCHNGYIFGIIKAEAVTEGATDRKVIARTELRELSCARTANEEQNTGALALSFIYAERNRRAFPSGRNRHQELTGNGHTYELRSVKTKKDYTGRELRSIENANVVNGCRRLHHGHAEGILASGATYFRNKTFNQIATND